MTHKITFEELNRMADNVQDDAAEAAYINLVDQHFEELGKVGI